MRSIGRSVRSVRSVCVKESKISVNKIFVLFVRFVFKKNSDLWFILVEHEIIVFEHEIRRRPTDRREVIIRITRIIFVHADLPLFNAHGSHRSHGSANASHGSRMSFFVPHYKSKNPIIKNCRRQRSV